MNDPQPTTDEERPRARSAQEVADDVVARVLARASRYDGTALQSTADGHTSYDGDQLDLEARTGMRRVAGLST